MQTATEQTREQVKCHKALYQRRRAEGKCGRCEEPARPGEARCDRHAATWKAQSKARYARRRAAGLCITCGSPALRNGVPAKRSLCEECTKDQVRHSTKYKQRMAVEDPERLRAARAKLRAAWRARQRASAGCIDCLAPATHGARCEKHAAGEDRRQQRRRKRLRGETVKARVVAPSPVAVAPVTLGLACAQCQQNAPMTGAILCWCCTNPPPKVDRTGQKHGDAPHYEQASKSFAPVDKLVNRCRCGLLLPCEECVPTSRDMAEARLDAE